MLMRQLCFSLLAALLLSCDLDSEGGGSKADEVATDWAEAYFNYDFKRADRLVAPEGRKWLRFAASNLTQEDIEVLQQQSELARVELTDCEYLTDSTWEATLEVSNFVMPDTIGRAARVFDEAVRFTVPVVSRNGRMYVKMEGLPRPLP